MSNENENENESESYDNSRQIDGRSVGDSIVFKYKTALSRVKVHNNISMKYDLEKRYLSCGKILPRDCLKKIIDNVTSKYGIDSSNISHNTVRSRTIRSNNIIVSRI